MPYTIRDTGTAKVATCEQTCEHLEDAIRVVNAELVKEELRGRVIDREREGRWAIYDGFIIKMLWIESDSGSVISFARQKRMQLESESMKNSVAA
jgi:hypothetical protein